MRCSAMSSAVCGCASCNGVTVQSTVTARPPGRIRPSSRSVNGCPECSARQVQGLGLDELLAEDRELIASCRRALHSGHPYTDRELGLILPGGRAVTVDCTVAPLQEAHQHTALLMELQRIGRHRRIVREENQSEQNQ